MSIERIGPSPMSDYMLKRKLVANGLRFYIGEDEVLPNNHEFSIPIGIDKVLQFDSNEPVASSTITAGTVVKLASNIRIRFENLATTKGTYVKIRAGAFQSLCKSIVFDDMLVPGEEDSISITVAFKNSIKVEDLIDTPLCELYIIR